MVKKVALIFGVTGQDGSYLAELLLSKGYIVHGVKRRASSYNTGRIDHIYRDPHEGNVKFFLNHGDVTDSANIQRLISNIRPDEIYNLAAQSHVAVSFELPEYTANVDALGTLRILEAIIASGLTKKTKFYQASTSELFGKVLEVPQNENTPFNPVSPYAVAKQYAFNMTKIYREAYNLFACNGILFNHESPRRGENFVTRKITLGLCRIKRGIQDKLYMGNLNSLRDWGHAKDFVYAQWLMLQKEYAEDFVIGTGQQISVKQFIDKAAKFLDMPISWKGEGLNCKGYDQDGNCIVEVDKRYYRPLEVDNLLSDPSKAREKLNWKAMVSLDELIEEMLSSDFELVKNETRWQST